MLEDLGRRAQDAAVILAGTSEKTRNDALEAIADKAIEMEIGARGLRSVMEGIMTDIMFSVPSDPEAAKVVVTEACVREGTEPTVLHRSELPQDEQNK